MSDNLDNKNQNQNQNQNTDNQNQNQNQNNQIDNQNQQPKTYTQAELDLLLQKEGDRRVSSAREKIEEEYKQKLEKERSEAEKLAQMSEAEKSKLEIERQKQEFESERKKFLREKLELQTVKELSALDLPTNFSSFILSNHESAEDIKKSIDVFKSEWEKAIEKAIDQKLQGSTPRVTNKKDLSVTKEQFAKMGYQERMEIYNTNKELYDQLSG